MRAKRVSIRIISQESGTITWASPSGRETQQVVTNGTVLEDVKVEKTFTASQPGQVDEYDIIDKRGRRVCLEAGKFEVVLNEDDVMKEIRSTGRHMWPGDHPVSLMRAVRKLLRIREQQALEGNMPAIATEWQRAADLMMKAIDEIDD